MVQLDDRFSVSQLAFTRARVQRVTAEVRHTGTQAGGQDGKVGRQVGRWVVHTSDSTYIYIYLYIYICIGARWET